jgi:hypothetical protein
MQAPRPHPHPAGPGPLGTPALPVPRSLKARSAVRASGGAAAGVPAPALSGSAPRIWRTSRPARAALAPNATALMRPSGWSGGQESRGWGSEAMRLAVEAESFQKVLSFRHRTNTSLDTSRRQLDVSRPGQLLCCKEGCLGHQQCPVCLHAPHRHRRRLLLPLAGRGTRDIMSNSHAAMTASSREQTVVNRAAASAAAAASVRRRSSAPSRGRKLSNETVPAL